MEEGSDEIALVGSSSDRRRNSDLLSVHASFVGVVIGDAFLGLSVLLLLRPVGRTALHS
jgi:hypothetical protein